VTGGRGTTGGAAVLGAVRHARGFTLIEVLVALVVASLITLALAQLARGTRASEAALDRALDPLQALDLAAELVREEVSLAARLPWPPPTTIADLPTGVDVGAYLTPGLVLAAGSHGDVLRVSYVDDRLAAGARARTVTFEAGRDAAGEAQLFRRAGSSSRQPLVAGVTGLEVVALAQAGALVAPGAARADVPVAAVLLRLRAADASRDVLVELPGRPSLGFTP